MFSSITCRDLTVDTFTRCRDLTVDTFTRSIMAAVNPGVGVTCWTPGVFEGPLNLEHGARHLIVNHYPDLKIGRYLSSFWVADDVDPFLEEFGDVVENYPGCIALFFTRIDRETQPAEGGWRWHKWGEYVGSKQPTCEYIHDEPDIDHAYVVRALEVRR